MEYSINQVTVRIVSDEFTIKTLRKWAEEFREEKIQRAQRLNKSLEISIGNTHEKGRF